MNYVTDDTMNAYLRSVQPMYDGVLGEIQKEAIAAEVPIVPPEVARLLSVLLTMQKPKNILEIGTAVAFSAGLMCRYLPEEGTVTTIDRYEVMLKDARVNIKRMGLEDKIKILEGDVSSIVDRAVRQTAEENDAAEDRKNLLILYLWMRRRGSIRRSCRTACGFCLWAVF